MAASGAHAAANVIVAAQKSALKKWAFLLTFFVVFALSFSFLLIVDFVPNEISLKENSDVRDPEIVLAASSPLIAAASVPVAASPKEVHGELPIRLEIPALGLDTDIDNPTGTGIEELDTALLKSAVRYPTSAELGTNGNVVLFAHSSYLPVVHNPAFKLFNGIQDLEAGDRITVHSEYRTYVYEVEQVSEADAASDAIPLNVTGSKLTLSTCDSFGAKTDRFIVVANLVETRSI